MMPKWFIELFGIPFYLLFTPVTNNIIYVCDYFRIDREMNPNSIKKKNVFPEFALSTQYKFENW